MYKTKRRYTSRSKSRSRSRSRSRSKSHSNSPQQAAKKPKQETVENTKTLIELINKVKEEEDEDKQEEKEEEAISYLKSHEIDYTYMNEEGQNLLIYACSAKCELLAIELLKTNQFDEGAVDNNNDTALMWCSSNNLERLAIELIRTGKAKIATIDHIYKNTALSSSVSIKVINELLKYPPNECLPFHQNAEGNNALMMALQTFEESTDEMMPILKKFIEIDKNHLKDVNKKGDTAFINACRYQTDPFLALELLKYPEFCLPVHQNENGNNALIFAVEIPNFLKVVKFLKNYSKESMSQVNKHGNTALMLAIDRDNAKAAMELLEFPEHCNILNKNHKDQNALILSTMHGRRTFPVFEKLIQLKATLDEIDNWKNTALLAACYKRNARAALELLKYPTKCNLYNQNSEGRNVLMLAILLEIPGVARQILSLLNSQGIDRAAMLSVADNNGETPFIMACQIANDEIANKLVLFEESNVGAVDKFGKTAIMYAMENNMQKTTRTLLQNSKSNLQQISLTTQLRPDTNALLLAAKTGKSEKMVLDILQKTKGVGVGNVDQYGNTALMLCLEKAFFKSADKIIDYPDANIDYEYGEEKRSALKIFLEFEIGWLDETENPLLSPLELKILRKFLLHYANHRDYPNFTHPIFTDNIELMCRNLVLRNYIRQLLIKLDYNININDVCDKPVVETTANKMEIPETDIYKGDPGVTGESNEYATEINKLVAAVNSPEYVRDYDSDEEEFREFLMDEDEEPVVYNPLSEGPGYNLPRRMFPEKAEDERKERSEGGKTKRYNRKKSNKYSKKHRK